MTKQEAINYIQEWLKDKYALNGKDRVVLNMAIEALREPTREWTIQNCPKCGKFVLKDWIVCPYCGANMRSEEE